MIIDTHQHLGRSMFSGAETKPAQILAAMEQHGVDIALVMPQPTMEPIAPIHDQIAEAAAQQPKRLYGIASINPWLSDGEYEAEARRCIRTLGFVALKLHPLGHSLAPNAPEADKVFRQAAELGVPVIIHTGLGGHFTLPSLAIPPARRYSHVDIVLAHAGWGVFSNEAMVAAEVCPNIYLEPSWCPTFMTESMVRRFGADRVLFGSDHLSNLAVELCKYRSINLTEAQLAWVLGRTAHKLFRI